MMPLNRRRKRPLEVIPQASQSVGPNQSYTNSLQGGISLVYSPTQLLLATAPELLNLQASNVKCNIVSPPSSEPPPITSTGILTDAIDRGAAAREAARIAHEKTMANVVRALYQILPDV